MHGDPGARAGRGEVGRIPGEREDPRPNETAIERAQRNFSELVMELRVAGLGVQVLFAFLLALPFEGLHFRTLSQGQIDLYLADVMLSACATVALGAPIAYHRWTFRRHAKERLLLFSNRIALVGLGLTALAISGSVGLVVSDVARGVLAPVLAAVVFGLFAAFWLVIPLHTRMSGRD